MLAQSNLFSVAVLAPAAPSWFTARADNAWGTVGTGSQKAVSAFAGVSDSNAYGLTHAWVGGCVDNIDGEYICPLPGGHLALGTTSSIYCIRVRSESPAWFTRRRVNDFAGLVGGHDGPGVYGNGQPSGTHTYNRSIVLDGIIWMPGIDSQDDGPGTHTAATFSFNKAQATAGEGGVWRPHGRWGTGMSDKLLGGSAAVDRVTKRIFTFPQYGLDAAWFHAPTVLAAADNVYPAMMAGVTRFAIPNQFGGGPAYSACFVDEEYRLLILVGTNGIWTYNVDNIGAGFTSRSSAPPISPYGGGYCYHQAAHRIYAYPWGGGGNTIRVMNVPASGSWPAWRNVTLGGITPPGVGDPFSNNAGGPFNRFNIVEEMGNGQACLLYHRYLGDTGIYVVKIAAGGL